MKGTSFRVAGSVSDASVTYQWSILTFFVQYQTTVDWSLNDCQLTIKGLSRDYQGTTNWYDHCHIDHYIDLTLPTIHMIQRTNLYKFVLKIQILSFFTSLIIYGCKNFSMLICWIHQDISNSAESWNWVQKVKVVWQQILIKLTKKKVAIAH